MGTGTLDMIRRCVEAGLAEPEFAVTDGFVTTVRRAAFSRQATERAMGRVAGRVGGRPESGRVHARAGSHAGVQEGHVGGQAEGQEGQAALSAKETAILQACRDGAVAAEALSAAAGHSSRTGHFKRSLNLLLAGGFLEMTVPDKPRSPVRRSTG